MRITEIITEAANPAQQAAIAIAKKKKKSVSEEWSQKYKSSINCSHPKGFSQKAHCAGKKKHNESVESHVMEMVCEDCGMCQTHGDSSRDTLDEACWKGYHKEGNKKMFGKTYPNCVKNEGVAEGSFGIDDKIKGRIQNIVSDLSDIPGMWDHKAQTFTDAGMDKLKTVLKNNPKYIKYALNLDYRDYEAEGVAEEKKPDFMKAGNMKPFKASGEEIPGAVQALEKLLLKAKERGIKLNYTNIDKIMQAVCKKHNLTGDELHNEFVDKHHMIPDNWIVKQLDEACWSTHKQVGMKNKGGKQVPNCVPKESIEEESCPHCSGPMFSEMIMNEKKDACYYKVKSRYKVWPSAYASGALVKCRNKGAANWGNSSKNESIEESIKQFEDSLEESLHDWFNKEKWVRMDTKGNIKGSCAREPGEGKPKCLPQSKAHSLGKKGRASAAQRKRREDPDPERSGSAINVNTKKKSNEGVVESEQQMSRAAKGIDLQVYEDWNKVNKKDKTSGMSQKAVNAYRRENPGSKLKTAVTTKPSKLKKGSKAANRRKSFCARMGGNKGPMKKPNGKPTPKALALRRWNCESIEELQELVMLAEHFVQKNRK